ncbi:MAG: hypothetical protein M1818_004577 [Claussenomyces sp. TS43310]|nr:MAG: hypothetical protein M1818_004577 [Claussenomyces sp. TS43310]
MSQDASPLDLSDIPVPIKDFIPYFSKHPEVPVIDLLNPFTTYENSLRKIYAQQPHHEAIKDGLTNLMDVFGGHESELRIRARSLDTETVEEKGQYIMPLREDERRKQGSPAIVSSLKGFRHNFTLFSESSLTDLDWSNVVAAGSAVTTALLPVPEQWAASKRTLRTYYHEKLAPASDVDLFLYGLTEEQAIVKIKQIEIRIKDSILSETTTIRTKNAITIASQYPTRHVQIVLRLYDSVSQIITGFDVDCACAVYDGHKVYASPRALIAFATQTNSIDLTRRSPSYENRLSKYSHRGFEVCWPSLDRSRIDPTIFERSFGRTQGLARLLVLEKLPKTSDRDHYVDLRREERGRPAANRSMRNQHRLRGNLKETEEDDVAEWVTESEISNYHTMVVPYGPRFTAAKINRLLYSKDLLLNAEWNKPDDREVHLHRHPCFFGSVDDVTEDCCGFCPEPKTDEEIEVAAEESKIYISGSLTFIKDDPGRQEIGSFHSITTDDWTEMAYVGNTEMLCQAIVEGEVEYVRTWCEQEGNDINERDHVGRTLLHLAVMSSTLEVVQCLIDKGARLIARVVDGRTALHLASARGELEMVNALMKRSLANADKEDEKQEQTRLARKRAARTANETEKDSTPDSDHDLGTDEEEESDEDSITTGSFVKIHQDEQQPQAFNDILTEDADEPDVFDIDILAWDFQASPLHFAILHGQTDMIRLLVEEYGADVLLPVKLLHADKSPRGAILTLVLALSLPTDQAKKVVALLLDLGATSAQGDVDQMTPVHYAIEHPEIVDLLLEKDRSAALSVLNHMIIAPMGRGVTALTIAVGSCLEAMVTKLLLLGAKPNLSFEGYIKKYMERYEFAKQFAPETSLRKYHDCCEPPLLIAASNESPEIMHHLLEYGADPQYLDPSAYNLIDNPNDVYRQQVGGVSLLDIVEKKLGILRQYRGESFDQSMPAKLKDQEFYLSGLEWNSYKYFTALRMYQVVRKANHKAHKSYEEGLKNFQEDTLDKKGAQEKEMAVARLIQRFEGVKSEMIAKGATTFREQYPDIPEPAARNDPKPSEHTSEPYKTTFSFQVPDLNGRRKAGYLKLFEAVWRNDLETVKALTLESWKLDDDECPNQPLKIAVVDNPESSMKFVENRFFPSQGKAGHSPFSIAVLLGHYKLARTIVEIAQAQYEPPDHSNQKETWAIRDTDSEGSSSNDESPAIFKELINKTFTIDNVAAVSERVKSDVQPLQMITWQYKCGWFEEDNYAHVEGAVLNDSIYETSTLMAWAIHTDDLKLVKFLLQVGTELSKLVATDDGSESFYRCSYLDFLTAVSLGRTAILAELIRITGAGLPLNEMVQKSGVVIKERPRYYQGLNVGGRKRTDWANAGRHQSAPSVHDGKGTPPLLIAAHAGSIESFEWLLSDAPIRMYKEFAAVNRADIGIRSLVQSSKGYEETVVSWLDARSELSLHCAILWNPPEHSTNEYVALVNYLLSTMPGSLDQKSRQGFTPLLLAATIQRREIMQLLVAAGADQRARDNYGRNVVHDLLVPLPTEASSHGRQPGTSSARSDPTLLRDLLSILDKEHVKEMLFEPCSAPGFSATTPLAYWMKNIDHKGPQIMEVLAEYSENEDLELISGEGDTPLHLAVKKSFTTIAEYIISVRETLLHRENATGRTPLEMVSDLYLSSRVSSVPSLAVSHNHSTYPPHRAYSQSILLSRPPSSFLPIEGNAEVWPDRKRTYEVCSEAAERIGPTKRRLVSLFEANEVARRLEGNKQRNDSLVRFNSTSRENRDVSASDEVDRWICGQEERKTSF